MQISKARLLTQLKVKSIKDQLYIYYQLFLKLILNNGFLKLN